MVRYGWVVYRKWRGARGERIVLTRLQNTFSMATMMLMVLVMVMRFTMMLMVKVMMVSTVVVIGQYI